MISSLIRCRPSGVVIWKVMRAMTSSPYLHWGFMSETVSMTSMVLRLHKISGHRGGADVYGHSVMIFVLARQDADDFLVVPDADGYLPVAVPQRQGKLPQGMDVVR